MATSIASSGRSSLPFARRYTLQTLQTLKHFLGMPHPAGNRHPKATSMASYGRPSLPFASPLTLKTLKRLKTLKTLQKLLGTPNRAGKSYQKAQGHINRFFWAVQPAVRLQTLKHSLYPKAQGHIHRFFLAVQPAVRLQTLKHSLGMPHPAANRHPKATSMASYGRPSLPFASP